MINNLTNRQKELLLKSTIVSGVVVSIMFLIFTGISQTKIEGTEEYNLYTTIALSFLGLGILICAFMYYLMGKVKITYKKIASKKLTLNTRSYEEFESKFLEELYNKKYLKYKEIPNELNCDIKYLINKNISINNIILIIRTNEFSYDAYKNYFKYCLNYIVEKEEYILKKNTNLMHIICVDKVNDNFKKITERNVEQGYGRFNLPVGISFDNRTVYIATQKGGFFIARYNKLVKMFKEYIKNQILNDVK